MRAYFHSFIHSHQAAQSIGDGASHKELIQDIPELQSVEMTTASKRYAVIFSGVVASICGK